MEPDRAGATRQPGTPDLEPDTPLVDYRSATEFTQLDPEAPESWPMVVWLRGDEPYVGAFCLTADQAMERLGIRRSRLTQISGRELRVGRIRQGRYVRPVYRQEDIEAYLGWTRAPATHQRSAQLVEEATSHLAEQSLRLENAIEGATRQVVSRVETTRDSILHEHRRLATGMRALHEQLADTNDPRILAALGRIEASLAQLARGLTQLHEASEDHAARIEFVPLAMTRISGQLERLERDNRDLRASLAHALETVAELQSEAIGLTEGLKHNPPPPRRHPARPATNLSGRWRSATERRFTSGARSLPR